MRSGEVSVGQFVRAVSHAYQVALVAWLLALATTATRPWTFYVYYAVLAATIPPGLYLLSGGRLTAPRRLYVCLGLAFHPISFHYGLYEAFVWWDVLAHFVSATLLAAGVYAACFAIREATDHHWVADRWPHVWAFLFVALGGVTWEFYETFVDASLTVYGPGDTLKDVFVDLGGWAAVATLHPVLVGDLPAGIVRQLHATRKETVRRYRVIRGRTKRRIRTRRRRVRRRLGRIRRRI